MINDSGCKSPLQTHDIVRSTNKPNFMQAKVLVYSQLNVNGWRKYLENYWDTQLIELIQFDFPLDCSRSCTLIHEQRNHKSAVEFPADTETYIKEELKYGALLGPFEKHQISSGHCSSFMTRAKPNSDKCCVIIDLRLPILVAFFSLTFPTVDNITNQLKHLGHSALLYKIDISRAFRHVKIDPRD